MKLRWQMFLFFVTGILAMSCGPQKSQSPQVSGDLQAIATERGLTPDDLVAAAKTYVPTGKRDEYYMFASGGHSGQVLVIGIPSMRLLKVIAVFTREPWQGWGFSDETQKILSASNPKGTKLDWGDTHHPALSETNGDYDGQFLFINDKANARVAVIDLRDFETKQIVKNPLLLSDHGGTFVTPNTDYVIEGSQYGMPWLGTYAPLSEYKEKYRGAITFWKFDRTSGRIQENKSFALELPPYWQDLADAGKLVSDGWVFLNTFNTEMATGGVEDGNPPFEAGASQRDMDYLNVINLRKAEELYKQGKAKKINGFDVIPLETSVKEGVLFFVPEPKSPHGIDVAPDGRYLVVSGKLDPHVTVYNFDKVKDAIDNKRFDGTDSYGVPILKFDDVLEKQIEVGLGPLHTQFGPDGMAYTSLFLESAIARWTLGGEWTQKHHKEPWTVIDKISVHYNVGHVAAAEGDTEHPDGKYLVSLDKWSIDRFNDVGPLLPQNLQLVDISNSDGPMQLLYDSPIGIGEPHYAQICKADKIKAWQVYPEVGWDPGDQAKSPAATVAGGEKIVRKGKNVEVFMTAVRSHYNPEHVFVNKGDHVTWHITNIERAHDATHGFALPYYDYNLSLEPGETQTIDFDATQSGVFPYYCSEFCSALHLEMAGYFEVKP
ncbi:MAG TPA: Sec-dependent nitrous-oxide reductase [Candidatus Krumholzibacteria bacterium]|nr:Sec-dependent nitrous-oxide reductase [Candidatus Krumholzibacteria bacterium]